MSGFPSNNSSTLDHAQFAEPPLRRVETFSSSDHEPPSLFNEEKEEISSEAHFSSSSCDSSSTVRGTVSDYTFSTASVVDTLDTLKDDGADKQLTFSRLLLAHVVYDFYTNRVGSHSRVVILSKCCSHTFSRHYGLCEQHVLYYYEDVPTASS